MEKIVKGMFAGAVALGGLYVLSTQGRTGHPGLSRLQGWKYAHRGLHDDEKPENSMAAFRAALEKSLRPTNDGSRPATSKKNEKNSKNLLQEKG